MVSMEENEVGKTKKHRRKDELLTELMEEHIALGQANALGPAHLPSEDAKCLVAQFVEYYNTGGLQATVE